MIASAPIAAGMPDGEALLALEQRVRRGGSGLLAADLQGCWQLHQIWPKGSTRPASFSGQLLRGLGARLEIAAADGGLQLCNAVTLGGLELRFSGPGRLVGARPLLQFHFDWLELRLSGRVLLRRALPEPPSRRLPFFALIARGPSGWLAARGRGGGLALWCLRPQPAEYRSGPNGRESPPSGLLPPGSAAHSSRPSGRDRGH